MNKMEREIKWNKGNLLPVSKEMTLINNELVNTYVCVFMYIVHGLADCQYVG